MEKKILLVQLFLIIVIDQTSVSQAPSQVTTKDIQKMLLTIKRNATNLEQILRKRTSINDFYFAPPTEKQITELYETSRNLIAPTGYFNMPTTQ